MLKKLNLMFNSVKNSLVTEAVIAKGIIDLLDNIREREEDKNKKELYDFLHRIVRIYLYSNIKSTKWATEKNLSLYFDKLIADGYEGKIIDILKELDWDNEIPESDTKEYQDWYDETYNRIYGELEDLNRQIESFLGGIDERYGTSYRPSGYTRFSVKTTNDRFNEELQQQIDGTLPNGHIYQLGMPGEILRSAGIPNLPIEMASQRLIHKSNQENHPFSLESVSNLPMAIQNPIAIFDSRTNRKSKVLLTELQYNGNNFVVALRLRNEGEGIDLEVNSIQSLYPKDRVGGVIEWVNTGLLRYANQKKLVDFLTQSTNLIAGKETDLNNATKIINDFENPKLSEENGTRFSIRDNAWSDVPAYNPGETIGEYIQRVNAWKLYLLHA